MLRGWKEGGVCAGGRGVDGCGMRYGPICMIGRTVLGLQRADMMDAACSVEQIRFLFDEITL